MYHLYNICVGSPFPASFVLKSISSVVSYKNNQQGTCNYDFVDANSAYWGTRCSNINEGCWLETYKVTIVVTNIKQYNAIKSQAMYGACFIET